ncbi:MAG: hypothetical protein H0X37_26605 [Herpetosiphonaceae bacterium]|nr:hypothetical protein [Herpetosiphonaceae bacterium]
MSNAPLFENTDEQEKAYAPQQLPTGENTAVQVEGSDTSDTSAIQPPSAAPVGTVGTSPSGFAAPIGEVTGDDAPDSPRSRR